jgi:hypothetical protein
MKIKMIKNHDYYVKGIHEVSSERGHYLIQIGAAVEASKSDNVEKLSAKEIKVDVPSTKKTIKKK